MLSDAAIEAEQQRIYESMPLRDDLDDAEAQILLDWGASQVPRFADVDDDFEQNCRFLRQLIRSINRFVGQRQYFEGEAQQKYLGKIMDWAPRLGYKVTEGEILSALPPDPADMAGTLQAILNTLTPAASVEPIPDSESPAPAETEDLQSVSQEPDMPASDEAQNSAASVTEAPEHENTDKPSEPEPERGRGLFGFFRRPDTPPATPADPSRIEDDEDD